MDITNEDNSLSLSFRLGLFEARESVGPQVYIAAIAYIGEFYLAGNVGYTEGKRHGPTKGWHEPAVREHYGPLGQQRILHDHAGNDNNKKLLNK